MKPDNQPLQIKQAAHITSRLLEQLAEKFPPETVVSYIQKLLTATHVTAGGKVIDDNRAIEAGVKLLLSYQVGLPIQRQEIVTMTVDGDKAIEEKLSRSPAMRKALKARIEQMDQQPSEELAVKPVEVEVESVNRIGETVKDGETSRLTEVLRKVKQKEPI